MAEDFQLELERAQAEQEQILAQQSQRATEQIGAVRSFFTGEGRTEGYPELGTSGPSLLAHKEAEPLPERYAPPGSPHKPLQALDLENVKKQARLVGGYTTTPDPQATADIALKTLSEVDPEASMDKDQYGNPTITFEGKKYYINAPGASEGDFFTLLGQIGAYAPAIKLSKARNLFTRMRQMGYLSFATSAGLDVAAGELGSEQGVDWTRALLTGATGALFEGLAPVVVHAWRTILNRPGMFDPATGQLTAKGKELALQAGLDPEMMTRRLSQAFAREVIDEPVPALAAPRAVQDVTGVKLTRGQQLLQAGETGQITWEEAARSGAVGEGAARVLGGREHPRVGFLGQQETSAGQFAEDVGEELARGGRPIRTESEGGAIIGEAIKRELKTLEGKIDDAYTDFRASSATLREEGVKTFRSDFIYKGLDDALENFDIVPDLTPGAFRVRALLREEIGKNEPITARSIEVLRKRMRNHWDGAKKADKKAVGRVIDAYDEWLDRSVTDGFFDGDQAAIDLVKDARKLRTEKRLKFGVSDKFDDPGKIIEDIVYRNANGEEVVNYLFGKAQLGDKGATRRAVERVREIVGADSPEWHVMRESAWLRLYADKTGTLKSPAKFVRDYDTLINRHPELMKEMFTEDERQLLYTARALMGMRVLPQRAGPAPNAGFRIMAMARRAIHMRATAMTIHGRHVVLGPLGHIFAKYLPWATGSTTARQATRQLKRPPPKAPALTATGTAGANVADPEGELRRELPYIP